MVHPALTIRSSPRFQARSLAQIYQEILGIKPGIFCVQTNYSPAELTALSHSGTVTPPKNGSRCIRVCETVLEAVILHQIIDSLA